MLTIGVLASGKGSNLQAVIDATVQGNVPFRVGVVISDNANARALERAARAGIAHIHIGPGKHRTFLEPGVERRYVECLVEHGVELVCLAGFMRVLKADFFRRYAGKTINIHPSLLPSFPGLESWKQALEYGVKVTGCTVHFVDEGVDTGPIIAQAAVPVLDGDGAESLHARIQEEEHRLLPDVLRLYAEGRISVNGRRSFVR